MLKTQRACIKSFFSICDILLILKIKLYIINFMSSLISNFRIRPAIEATIQFLNFYRKANNYHGFHNTQKYVNTCQKIRGRNWPLEKIRKIDNSELLTLGSAWTPPWAPWWGLVYMLCIQELRTIHEVTQESQ